MTWRLIFFSDSQLVPNSAEHEAGHSKQRKRTLLSTGSPPEQRESLRAQVPNIEHEEAEVMGDGEYGYGDDGDDGESPPRAKKVASNNGKSERREWSERELSVLIRARIVEGGAKGATLDALESSIRPYYLGLANGWGNGSTYSSLAGIGTTIVRYLKSMGAVADPNGSYAVSQYMLLVSIHIIVMMRRSFTLFLRRFPYLDSFFLLCCWPRFVAKSFSLTDLTLPRWTLPDDLAPPSAAQVKQVRQNASMREQRPSTTQRNYHRLELGLLLRHIIHARGGEATRDELVGQVSPLFPFLHSGRDQILLSGDVATTVSVYLSGLRAKITPTGKYSLPELGPPAEADISELMRKVQERRGSGGSVATQLIAESPKKLPTVPQSSGKSASQPLAKKSMVFSYSSP